MKNITAHYTYSPIFNKYQGHVSHDDNFRIFSKETLIELKIDMIKYLEDTFGEDIKIHFVKENK